MKCKWIIWLLVTGVIFDLGRFHICDIDLANEFYEDLLMYENSDSPIYFLNELEVNITCSRVFNHIEYILIFKNKCRDGKEFYKKMHQFNYTLIKHLEHGLCQKYISRMGENDWDTDETAVYYGELQEYTYRNFPFYGKDEEELNDVCRKMNEFIEYLQIYLEKYNKKKECESFKCLDLTNNISELFTSSGIKDFAEDLCNDVSFIRKTYLDIYPCLENNLQHFSKCKKKSDVSRKYLGLQYLEKSKLKYEACCLAALYRNCITSITKDHCDENATIYVASAFDRVYFNNSDDLCISYDIICSSPPLPPQEDGTPKQKIHTTDEVDQDETFYDTYNSNVDEQEMISASIISCPFTGIMVAFHIILFMNFLII